MRRSSLWTVLVALGMVAAACSSEATETLTEEPTDAAASPSAAVTGGEETPVLAPGTIVTVVGTGEIGTEGVGGPATDVQLKTPTDVAFDADGNLYIADSGNHRVLSVDPAGIVVVVAGKLTSVGNPDSGFSGDGGPAAAAELNSPHSIAVGSDGNLYIADQENHRVRRIDQNGIITTVAGTGEGGFSGDGGPATEADLSRPVGLALDAQGNLYVADFNHRIRVVGGDGTITTIAGTGEGFGDLGFSPDGTPAAEALLGTPLGLAIDGSGRLYFSEGENRRIRFIDAEGLLQTVAGNGEDHFSGDGGPATEAGFDAATADLSFDAAGNLYLAVTDGALAMVGGGHRVRMVDPDGIITTLAGTGVAGYSGDGGPATEAQLTGNSGVAIGPDGNLYIADGGNHVIRMVVP